MMAFQDERKENSVRRIGKIVLRKSEGMELRAGAAPQNGVRGTEFLARTGQP
jgi:hypothetical protein